MAMDTRELSRLEEQRLRPAANLKVYYGDEVVVARSQEIGAGGMALANAGRLEVAQPVKVAFTLPAGRGLKLDAVVWWKRDQRVGIRFDPRDGGCRLIQHWVEEQKAGQDTAGLRSPGFPGQYYFHHFAAVTSSRSRRLRR